MKFKHYQLILIAILCLLPVPGLAKSQINITAKDDAIIDEKAGLVTFKKDVLVKTTLGGQMKTDLFNLHYDASRNPERAIAEGNVEFSKDQLIGTCTKAIVLKQQNTAELFNLVHIRYKDSWLKAHHIKYNYKNGAGIIKGNVNKPVTFFYEIIDEVTGKKLNKVEGKADQITINQLKQEVVLQGKVSMKESQSNATMTTRRLQVKYNQFQKIDKIYANGKFVLKQENRLSTSDRAILDYTKEIIILIGNAKVETEKGTLQSSRIEMHMKSSRGLIKADKDRPLKMKIDLE